MKNSKHNILYAKRYPLYAILIALLLLILPCTAQAAEYYLDAEKGNDANAGTSDAPWRTLNRAYTWYSGSGPKVQEGDTVYFRNGNYGQFSESAYDGMARHFHRTNWIIYKADTGCFPNLTNILVVNFHPGTDPPQIGESYLKFEGFNIAPTDATQNAVDLGYTSYIWIKNCNIANAAVAYTGAFAPYYWNSNCIGAVDVIHLTIEGSTIANCAAGVIVKNNEIAGSSYITIKNNTVHNTGDDGITVDRANDSEVSGNYVYNLNAMRIPMKMLGDMNGTFTLGDVVTLNSNPVATGIFKGIDNGYFKIWQTSAEFFWSPIDQQNAAHLRGDTITGPNGTFTNITYLDIEHTDCMTISHESNVIVKGNKLFRNMTGDECLVFGGAQALKLDAPTDIEVSDNLIVAPGIASPEAGVTLLMGGGTTNFNLFNNTMIGAMLVRNIAPAPLEITNMYNNLMSYMALDADGGCKPHIINHGNNIFGNNPDVSIGLTYPFATNGTEIGSYDINSLFVDAANNDFRLKEDSKAINFGDPAYAPATDILGNPRDSHPDAGCYEYGSSAPSNATGDINNDGSIDAIDLQLLINMILSGNYDSKADLNSDSSIDAVDLQRLVNIILG